MLPPGGMSGTTRRTSVVTWVKFSSTNVSSPLALSSRNGAKNVPPALLTSVSTRPHSATTSPTHEVTASRSRTSRVRASAGRPVAATAAAVSSRASSFLSHIATVAPKRASSSALARPMPWPTPVTSATRSVSRIDDGSCGTQRGYRPFPRRVRCRASLSRR